MVLSIGACRSGNADLVFSETLDIAVSNESEFSAHYPNFQVVAGSADITVPSSNRLQLNGATDSHIRLVGVSEWKEIELDIGRIEGARSRVHGNVGIVIGDNTVVFHPGHDSNSGLPLGSLRVEGPGGFGNQDVGYVPATSLLHTLKITGDGAGDFAVNLTDANNAANISDTNGAVYGVNLWLGS